VGLFLPPPTTFLGTYLFYEGGNLLLILLMLAWDWKRNRVMKQFLWGSFLVTAVGFSATGLYFNETWQSISRSWLMRGRIERHPPGSAPLTDVNCATTATLRPSAPLKAARNCADHLLHARDRLTLPQRRAPGLDCLICSFI
jgi:hypothetical protein